MSLFVTEYASFGPNGLPSIAGHSGQTMSIGSSVSTGSLGTGTYTVGLQADTGCYVAAGTSTAALTPGSSNGVRIAANLPIQFFNVSPSSKLFALST